MRVVPASEPLCKSGDTFRFSVEYEQRGERPMYIHLTLLDTLRGGVTYGKKFDLNRHGHQIIPFSLPMKLFNNGNFRILVSMHVAGELGESNASQMVAFSNESNSCNFVVQGEAGADTYALINCDAMDCECIDPNLAVPK